MRVLIDPLAYPSGIPGVQCNEENHMTQNEYQPIRILDEDGKQSDYYRELEANRTQNAALLQQFDVLEKQGFSGDQAESVSWHRGRIEVLKREIGRVEATAADIRQEVAEVAQAEVSPMIMELSLQDNLRKVLWETIVLLGHKPDTTGASKDEDHTQD